MGQLIRTGRQKLAEDVAGMKVLKARTVQAKG